MTAARVQHNEPLDLMLNTCQMRSAVHVQCLRIVPVSLSRDEAILASARAEVDAQKVKE
ncbi:uncharacterized protein B0H18DRAFT_829413, partial [Fomitopsis serialis]|uniref:uncharacterized protein n=1 Tax=Fomitopsis serialis TaxID=139415 RepID=UPI002008DFDD